LICKCLIEPVACRSSSGTVAKIWGALVSISYVSQGEMDDAQDYSVHMCCPLPPLQFRRCAGLYLVRMDYGVIVISRLLMT
jgi:hypothetical protein